ncbi:transposable element Tc1 transposase [Trichonephila clavipes]|nr:transposable element Tc1 transposase [Trichonephila clavipes]
MPCCRIRAHYEPEFKRGRIIRLKEAVFSDEFRFQLCPDDNRRRVWRSPGQRADPAFTIEHHTGPKPGVMVWGAISFDNRTPFVVIRGNLQHIGTLTTL